ncbi:hypothetical protein GW891_03725 [bacterium]|nr:hypothetical protein [bacterium]
MKILIKIIKSDIEISAKLFFVSTSSVFSIFTILSLSISKSSFASVKRAVLEQRETSSIFSSQ